MNYIIGFGMIFLGISMLFPTAERTSSAQGSEQKRLLDSMADELAELDRLEKSVREEVAKS